jgi:hypothetical protein
MVMSPFRRGVKADTKRTGGGGSKKNFYDRFRLPAGSHTPIVFINAEYTDPNPAATEAEVDPATGRPLEVKKPYFKARKHKRKILKNGREFYLDTTCSAGYNPHAPQPCLGCAAMDQGDKSITVSDIAVFGVFHLAAYHRHPLIDKKTGGIVMKRETNAGAVMIETECSGRTCNFCRALGNQPIINDPQNPWPNYRPQDIQTTFGKRRYMELGKNHLEHLLSWDTNVSQFCGHDQTELYLDGFACPHCNSLVIDMTTEQRTDLQIQEAVSIPYPCLRCQKQVLLYEVNSCPTCEAWNQQNPNNQRQPIKFGIFDRVLWGGRAGEGTASRLDLLRHESIEEFAARNPGIAPLLGGKTLRQHIEEIAKPYEFAQMYEPKSLPEQAKALELAPVAQTPQQYVQAPGQPQYQQAPGQPQYAQAPGAMPPQYPQAGQAQAPQQYAQPAPPPGYPPQVAAPSAPGPAAPPPQMRPNFGNGQTQ